MKIFIKSLFIILIFLSKGAISLEKGEWNFVKEDNWCYIGSIPTKEEGKYTKRGDVYLIVYKINKSQEIIVQINAGYNYKENEPVEIIIDQVNFDMFSDGDSAWSEKQDKEITYAMMKGKDMFIKGVSSRGTSTKDTYTLIGFTAAFKKIDLIY